MKPTVNKKSYQTPKKFKVTFYIWEKYDMYAGESIGDCLEGNSSGIDNKKEYLQADYEKYLEIEEVKK